MYGPLSLAKISESLISKHILKFCLYKSKNVKPGVVWCESGREKLNSAVTGICFIILEGIIIVLDFVNILNVSQKLFLKKNIIALNRSSMISR